MEEREPKMIDDGLTTSPISDFPSPTEPTATRVPTSIPTPIREKLEEVHGHDKLDSPKRSFGPFNIIAAAFNICQAWAAIAATFALGIAHGGSVMIIYGLILITIIYSAIALSMAEMAARYPTTGGQYHWSYLIAPKSVQRELSYVCGSINTIGWITLTASVLIIPPQIVVGMIKFYSSTYIIERWHVFLIYQGLNIMSLLYNVFALQRIPGTHDVGFFLSIGSFLAITISCLIIASPKEPSDFVWTNFTNETGWNVPGIAFLTGLINLNYGFAGLDGAIHLTDECLNAAMAVPWALLSAILASFVTAMIFVIATLYCVQDFHAVLNTPTSVPIYEIWHQATRSPTAASIFVTVLGIILIFTLLAAQQTSSRLIWSFARDDALLLSKYLKKINSKLSVPVWALLFNWIWVFILGCVYLASSTAFNAIVAPGLILEQISFAFPAALLIWQLRDSRYLPTKGPFRLGKAGWIVNVVTVAWAVFEIVFYTMPPELPVTSGNMNYTCAVLGGIGLFILFNWYGHAKKHFQGPKVNFEELWQGMDIAGI